MKDRRERKKPRYINGTKGVISLFLAILMVPFCIMAGVLINLGRTYSAAAIFDEALCNASDSTLGTYDSFLQKRFGLLAIDQAVNGQLTEQAVQEFISKTFEYYMELNCGVLSNTYSSITTSATGVYPLADTSVLKEQILEYSKYSVPTQLVSDALNVEGWINNINKMIPGREYFSLFTNFFNTCDAGSALGDDIDLLKDKTATQAGKESEYDSKYTAFETAVNKYWDKVAERDQAERDMSYWQAKMDAEARKNADLVNQIAGLDEQLEAYELIKKNEDKTYTDEEVSNAEYQLDEENDDPASVAYTREQLYDSNQQVLEEYNTAKQNYENAETRYNEAVAALPALQTAAEAAQSAYAASIKNLIDAVKAVQQQQQTVVNDAESIASNGTAFLKDTAGAAIDAVVTHNNNVIQSNNEQLDTLNDYFFTTDPVINDVKDELNYSNEDKSGMWEYGGELQDANENLTNLNSKAESAKAGLNETADNMKTATKELTNYDKVMNTELCNELLGRLSTLKSTVESYDVSQEKAVYSMYYISVSDELLTTEEVDEFQTAALKQAAASTGIGVLKGIITFIKAIYNLMSTWDEDLDANVTVEGHSPSSNSFAASDAEKAQEYLEAIGAYSTGSTSDTSYDLGAAIDAIHQNLNTIFEVEFSFISISGFFNGIKAVKDAIKNIFAQLQELSSQLTSGDLFQSIQGKILLTGYASYVTSCRTTYESGTKLTQTSATSALPPTTIEQSTCFYGAETEYLVWGSSSEKTNQENMFWSIFCVKVLLNMPTVLMNSEVQTYVEIFAAVPFVGCVLAIVYLVVLVLVR